MPIFVKTRLIAASIDLVWPIALEIIQHLELYAEGISACEIQSINPNVITRKVISSGIEVVERLRIDADVLSSTKIAQKLITSTFLSNPAASGKTIFAWEWVTELTTNFIVTLDWEWVIIPENSQDVLDKCDEKYLDLFTKDF